MSYVAAIDLGTTKVVTIVGERTSQGVKIIGYSEAPSTGGIKRGEVINIQKVITSLAPTIEEVETQINEKLTSVFVGISGHNIRCETVSLSKSRDVNQLVSEQEVSKMTEEMYFTKVNPDEQVFHVIPQSYNVGEQMGTSDPVGMMGNEIEGNYRLFVGKTSSATHTKSVINRSGLQLNKLIIKPIASATAVLTQDEMELGVVLVDIGGGTTDVVIYHDNVIRHSAVIPFGGKAITEDIRQVCGVPLKFAKLLKEKHGSCISEYAPENKTIIIPGVSGTATKEVSYKLLASTIESRVEEIIATIMHEIQLSKYQKRLRSGIVITGGSSFIVHLDKLVSHLTGMSVRIAAPDVETITANSIETIFNKPGLSTAVGLIMEGLELQDSKEVEIVENLPSTIFPEEVEGNISPSKKGPKPEKGPRKSMKETIGGMWQTLFETENDA